VAFRREARAPKGGPDGGDGGKGGDVLLSCQSQLDSLGHLLGKSLFAAEHGRDGMPSNKKGKNGEDRVLPVPIGTTAYDVKDELSTFVADMTEPKEVFLLARGGKGGKGNARYKTPVDQAPTRHTPGFSGQEKHVRLVLRLNSDICLAGYPNAGHSSLLERLTGSSQKITVYPFSTRSPKSAFLNLDKIHRSLLLDLPSLGENAPENHGSGSGFLRHAERCTVLLLVVSLERHSTHQLDLLLRSVESHGKGLLEKKLLVVANKWDLPGAKEEWTELADFAHLRNLPLVTVSCVTGFGLEDLEDRLCKLLSFQN